jgi:hypothetical protein
MLIRSARNMNAAQLVTKLSLGACAFVAPSLGIFIAAGFTWSTDLFGLAFFALVVAATLAIAAYLSWACVRHGGMSVKLAAAIPAIPFAFMVALTLPALFIGFLGPLFLWGLPLALVLIVGRRVGLHAQSQTTQNAEQAAS